MMVQRERVKWEFFMHGAMEARERAIITGCGRSVRPVFLRGGSVDGLVQRNPARRYNNVGSKGMWM